MLWLVLLTTSPEMFLATAIYAPSVIFWEVECVVCIYMMLHKPKEWQMQTRRSFCLQLVLVILFAQFIVSSSDQETRLT